MMMLLWLISNQVHWQTLSILHKYKCEEHDLMWSKLGHDILSMKNYLQKTREHLTGSRHLCWGIESTNRHSQSRVQSNCPSMVFHVGKRPVCSYIRTMVIRMNSINHTSTTSRPYGSWVEVHFVGMFVMLTVTYMLSINDRRTERESSSIRSDSTRGRDTTLMYHGRPLHRVSS